MSEIDWSKAPEGATHVNPGNSLVRWYRLTDHCWYYWSETDNAWCESKKWGSSGLTPRPLIPRPDSWDGKVPPPVGTLLELKAPKFGWVKGKVVGYDHEDNGTKIIVCWCEDELLGYIGATQVRPIKSDRERQIEDALKVIDKADLATCEWHAHAERVIGSMVDAGYRRAP